MKGWRSRRRRRSRGCGGGVHAPRLSEDGGGIHGAAPLGMQHHLAASRVGGLVVEQSHQRVDLAVDLLRRFVHRARGTRPRLLTCFVFSFVKVYATQRTVCTFPFSSL